MSRSRKSEPAQPGQQDVRFEGADLAAQPSVSVVALSGEPTTPPASLEEALARHTELRRLRLLSAVHHDGQLIPAGAVGLWPPAEAAALIAAGAAVEEPPEPEAPADA